VLEADRRAVETEYLDLVPEEEDAMHAGVACKSNHALLCKPQRKRAEQASPRRYLVINGNISSSSVAKLCYGEDYVLG
jgi:hypothetical protein